MTTVDYNDISISVPDSWDDITLGFYETFSTKKPETTRERVALVAHICKTSPDVLLNWPAEVFNRVVGHIGFLFEDNPAPHSPLVEVGGVNYVVPIEDELTLGAWVDLDDVQKKGENVLSNVLAIVCRPVGEEYDYKNNEARAAMFAGLPVSKVLGVLAFFLQCKNVSEQRTAAYARVAALADQLPRSIRPSQSPGGGIRLSQIWPILKYCALSILLRYQLRRFLHSCNTKKTKTVRTKRNIN